MMRTNQVIKSNSVIDNVTANTINNAESTDDITTALEGAKVEILKDISITLALIADKLLYNIEE